MEIAENTFESMVSPQFNAEYIVNLDYDGNTSLDRWVNERGVDNVSVFSTQVKLQNNTFKNNYIQNCLVRVNGLADVTVSGNRYENNVDITSVEERNYNDWLKDENPNAC